MVKCCIFYIWKHRGVLPQATSSSQEGAEPRIHVASLVSHLVVKVGFFLLDLWMDQWVIGSMGYFTYTYKWK